MKIHCTSGCVCDCFTVDGEDLSAVNGEKKLELINRMEKYILKNKFKEYYMFDGLLSEIYYLDENFLSIYLISYDDETCEYFLHGESLESVYNDEYETIVKDFFQYLKDNDCDINQLCWWFMRDYVGLKYQYHCDCCGDSVYSKTINI